MKTFLKKVQTWFWFTFRNPVIRQGESGGFKWVFRRLDLRITTVSGNFVCRFTAAEHPYAYLISGKDDENIIGFCQMLYYLGMVITTDQGIVDDVKKAFAKYEKRLSKKAASDVIDDEMEEALALEDEKRIQEHKELPKAERRKVERDINGRFKKVAKEIGKNQ